jgi:hypothetical protein
MVSYELFLLYTRAGVDGRGMGIRLPARAGDFSLLYRVHTGSGAQPASFRMGSGSSFLGGKVAEA